MKTQLSGMVLVVEDNVVNQKLMSSILKKIGLYFAIANHGEEAISLWQNRDFDLILMDCQMPIMDGYIATQTIRQQEKYSHIPIIALTANAMENDDIRCKDAGMDDFLSKPFVINDLVSMLEKWLCKPDNTSHSDNQSLGLNYDVINELKDVLEEGFYEVIDIYINSTTSILSNIKQACNNSDYSEVQLLAHSLKSSSANVGATKLSSLANNIEHQIMNNDFSNINEQINEMNMLFISISPILKSL